MIFNYVDLDGDESNITARGPLPFRQKSFQMLYNWDDDDKVCAAVFKEVANAVKHAREPLHEARSNHRITLAELYRERTHRLTWRERLKGRKV